jgi:hypothetical protein
VGNQIKPQFTPTGCLLNAYRRDIEKGYKDHEAGWRSTREVQEFVGEPLEKVRRELTKLSEAGLVSFLKDPEMGAGNALFWSINEPVKPGDTVKVIRPSGHIDNVEEATVEAVIKSCVLPIQVKFADGHQTGYIPQEIREIVL